MEDEGIQVEVAYRRKEKGDKEAAYVRADREGEGEGEA